MATLTVMCVAGVASTSAAADAGRYIVVLNGSAGDPQQVAAEHGRKYGLQRDHVYSHALKGYAARMPAAAVRDLRSDPHVRSVWQEGTATLTAAAEPCTDLTLCQLPSIAVTRIGADVSTTRSGDGRSAVPVNVAVIDSGVDVDHPDLNVVGGTDCIGGNRFRDYDDPLVQNPSPFTGHGTKVAGFIGALDNSYGRVGVAPGARLWAVKASGPQSGVVLDSSLICALDFVAASRTDADPTNDIAVANMSLSGKLHDEAPCSSTQHPVRVAFCRIVALGVVPVVAAGNEHTDIAGSQPAAWEEALTATAINDDDGRPGALGPGDPCAQAIDPDLGDDMAAPFSNYATLAADKQHTVAAHGVCIGSTYPGGQYAAGTGTSFAAPIVAGTVALCIYSGPCAGLTPAQVIRRIVDDARAYNESSKGRGYGFLGDPLRPITGKYYGYLIRAALY